MSKKKTLAECTEQEKKFLAALGSIEILEVSKKERYKWAAEQAGFETTESLSSIMAPIQHLIKDVVEMILVRSSLDAALQLADTAADGQIDVHTEARLKASRDILDRVVPKKGDAPTKSDTPVAILVLPAKQEIASAQIIDSKDYKVINANLLTS